MLTTPVPGFGKVTTSNQPWTASGTSRKDRRPYRYDAWIPSLIGSAELLLPGSVVNQCELAAVALHTLNTETSIRDLEAVAASLVRSESVASSRIENLRASHRRVAEALDDPRHAGKAALEVSRNVAAMQTALAIGDHDGPITLDTLRSIHRALLDHTTDAALGGVVRSVQSWIGGSSYGPRTAIYVPPPPELVHPLLDDLVVFANRRDLSPISQAAILHAQFEAIHPFVDGNGRTGRCLVHLLLRRRGTASRVAPPISAALMADRDRYFSGLASYQQRGEVDAWVGQFADAALQSVEGARVLAAHLVEVREGWWAAAGSPRSGSVVSRLIDALPGSPLLSAESASRMLHVDPNTVRRGLNHLEQVGVVRVASAGRRNRVWAADDVFDLLDEFEHTLTAGKGPTRHLRGS